MDQMERIREMERRMERAGRALGELSAALENYRAVQEDLEILEDYLRSPRRREDLAADEAGLLPPTLRRGVLSEDGLYDLLKENDALRRELGRWPETETE